MSDFEERTYLLLREAFPKATIKTQHAIKFKDELLIFDFYLPMLNIVVECQGKQHYQFVKHFHGTQNGFKHYQYHDNLKIEWAKKNKVNLITISYKEEPKEAWEIFELLYESMEI